MKQVLSRHKIEEGVADIIAWANVRDCVKIGTMARTVKDVQFVVDNFCWAQKWGRIQ